ncbi:MAG: adenylate/guanylate cyclase domain-containing protein [Chloroflexi bacterium]|nr:adenylate/guanylate cyclase domain-containing protein [Chloroflexota bacterium]
MEPQVQYAKTSDGVNIAYATTGEGPPLVVCPDSWEQFSLYQQVPFYNALMERLGKGRLLVQYDGRGTGLSERKVEDFSLEARLRDLEAVVRAARIRRFALYATTTSGPVAIAYAAHHQRQVGQLILYGTFSHGAEVMPPEQLNPLIELCRSNWELASQVLSDLSSREQYPDVGVQMSELFRASCTGEVAAEILAQGLEIDVDDLLPLVKAPTLVIHRRSDSLVPFTLGQKLAAGIRKARFIPLEGTHHASYLGESEPVIRAIDEFLGEGAEAGLKLAPDDVHTILFTDVEGSTALMERLGDAKARDLLREHERMVREALKSHRGSEVKTMGDGFMTSFGSATAALGCAITMQRAFAEHNESADEPIKVRIGLNAGEPIAEDDPGGRADLFGTAVNMAARIAAKAEGGEILVSNVVRELSAGKGFLFNDRGDAVLRGFEDPVRLYEVSWRES